ncbi:MAG: hypothetical protein M1829_006869 [Trizodia sp. TS-e1964]|nr:MAG: hypothetical protein M1829_006869 [Trizodia sp. TS-e1964]
MEFSNIGSSIYHEVQAIYSRHTNGRLLYITGRAAKTTKAAWPSIQKDLEASSSSSGDSASLYLACPETVELAGYPENTKVTIREMLRSGTEAIVGVIVATPFSSTLGEEFRNWFTGLIIRDTRLGLVAIPASSDEDESRRYAQAVTDVFDRTLRNISKEDQWDMGGRIYFEERLYFYTSRMVKIEFCLPAFPCKSSNLEKVMGIDPDKGEEIALQQLNHFMEEVGKIYSPGAIVEIVSDGHVFSDCIGVNDDIVDRYSDSLIKMAAEVHNADSIRGRVRFNGLADLFALRNISSYPEEANFIEVPHLLNTQLTKEAEVCRKILLAGCQIDGSAIRKQIDSQESSILSLYRGFAKFMLEDLDLNSLTADLSRSKRKKLASKVAFEMIRNSGPKFGIKLLSNKKCKTVESLKGEAHLGSDDLLHIPTPWHNSVFRMENDPTYYVTKAKVIFDAFKAKTYYGKWIEDTAQGGGYFHLSKGERTSDAVDPGAQAVDKQERLMMRELRAIQSVAQTNMPNVPNIFL